MNGECLFHIPETIPDIPTQLNKKHSATSDKTVNKSVEKGYSDGHMNGKSDARVLRKHPNHAEQQDSTPRRQASGLSSRQMFEKDKSQSTPGLRGLDAIYMNSCTEKSVRIPGSLASQSQVKLICWFQEDLILQNLE